MNFQLKVSDSIFLLLIPLTMTLSCPFSADDYVMCGPKLLFLQVLHNITLQIVTGLNENETNSGEKSVEWGSFLLVADGDRAELIAEPNGWNRSSPMVVLNHVLSDRAKRY